MVTTTKLLIENKQPKDISGCQPGVREHVSHGTLEFNPEMFEILPATAIVVSGNLIDLRRRILQIGRTPANATILEFLQDNQELPEIKKFLKPWKKQESGHPFFLCFLGTTYRSLTYPCNGDIRMFAFYKEFGWTGNTPTCLDDNINGLHYVVLLK